MKNQEIPSLIDNQYNVITLLGEGVSGRVFKVSKGQGLWALKLLKGGPKVSNMEDWIEAFKFEFSLLKDIVHPHVVKIGDFGWDKKLDCLYFTEELMDGVLLNDFLKKSDVKKGEELFIQCLEGLEAIHQAKALHGDIKPNNIFVTHHGTDPWIKILDLGIAHPRFHLTAGTPAYFAPERILKDPIDERSDLYSLAVTFYECLTGVNPFKRANAFETLKAQTSIVPPEPGSLNPSISPYFNRILTRLLAKNPRERIRDATEVLMEFDYEHGLETTREIKAPLVSEKWVGRKNARDSVMEWAKKNSTFSILAITGEKGIGKTRLLQECKYDLELGGQSIRMLDWPQTKTFEAEALYLYDLTEDKVTFFKTLITELKDKAKGLMISLPLDVVSSLEKKAKEEKIPLKTLKLVPMTAADILELVILTTHDPHPPKELIDGLYRQTKGHPGHTVHLLSLLCQENKLIGPHGEWNLALFREGPIDIFSLTGHQDVLEDLLRQTGPDKPMERLKLLIQKSEENLRTRKKEACEPLFKECEEGLKKIAAGNDRLTLKARLLEKKGWKAIQEANFERANANLEAAKALLQEMEDPPQDVWLRVHNFQAYILMHTGKNEEAIRVFEKTHREWKSLQDEDRKKVMNNDLGIASMHAGEYEKAISFFKEQLRFYETLSDPTYKNRCHYNLGECEHNLENYDQALAHYQAAADGARSHQQWDLLLRAYNGLGNAANLLRNPESSVIHYQRALELARYLKDYPAAAAVAQNMGVIQKELGKKGEARTNLELSLKLLKQVHETLPHLLHLKARALLELGQLERQEKNFDLARELFVEARQITQSDKSLDKLVYWILYAQAQLALDQNKPDEFGRYYPDLSHHAKTEEQKNQVEFLKQRSPVDPTLPRLQTMPARHTPKKEENAMPVKISNQGTTPIRSSFVTQTPKPDPLTALLDINQFLNSERNLVTLFSLILKYALNLSSAESGLILLLDEGFELFVASSLNIQVDANLSQISRTVAERVLKEGSALRIDNATEDEEFKHYQSVISLGLKSIYCVPIRSQRKVIGVLYLIHRFQSSLFSSEAGPILQAFADQAGLAIENTRLLSKIEEQNELLKARLSQAEEKIESYESILQEKKFSTKYNYNEIIAQSGSMEKLFHLLDRITSTNLSVLIHGESGTGKELIARALHYNSPRAGKRFVAINCGALPPNLIESELFGYKAGAFTGANRDKKGLFEEASGGTLFLDEIAELDLSLQVKLLRALQEREIVRVGDTKTIPIDVRLVAATLKDLKKLIGEGKFREDLFYRIAEIQLKLPPLRERREDIPLLVNHFVKQFSKEHDLKKNPSVDKRLMHLFMNYAWPGNIRELSGRVRVACALCDGKMIMPADLPDTDREQMHQSMVPLPKLPLGEETSTPASNRPIFAQLIQDKKSWHAIETVIMAKALILNDFQVIETATGLGIGQATLYNRLRNENLRTRQNEFEGIPFHYAQGLKLEDIKKEVFEIALELSEQKPYHAARLLDVSPGMFYKWAQNEEGS